MATDGSMLTRNAPQDQHLLHKLRSIPMPSSVRLCATLPRRETSRAANSNTAKPTATARPTADIVVALVHSRQLKAIPGANPSPQTAQSATNGVSRLGGGGVKPPCFEVVTKINTRIHQSYLPTMQGKPSIGVGFVLADMEVAL